MATKPKTKVKAKPVKAEPEATSPDIIQGVLESIQKEVGVEGAQLLGSDGLTIKIRGVIPTGAATVDAAIGRGGIPLGRLTILHGAEGSGKTTLALMIVAACQAAGGVVVYCDKEYKLDPDYAKTLGVDIDHVIWAQPPYLEKFFQTAEGAIKRAGVLRKAGKRVPIIIVLDSMNAAITKAQFEGEWDQKHMAPQARVFSELLPKLMPEVHKEDVALLFISQVRKKMNVMFGNDEEIAGGNAPRFYASLILYIQRLGSQKDEGGEKVSNKIRIEAKKNQIAPPFKKADCQIVYGHGIDKELALLAQAEKLKLAEKNGAWWSFQGKRLGQGDEAAANNLRSHPELEQEIRKAVTEEMGW
jgi:recombination protein RecA